MSPWFTFWIAVAVFIAAEAVLTLRGMDTNLWQFRTPAELQLQQRLIEKRAAVKPTTPRE